MALNFCNNNSLSAITALPATISGGGLNLISTQTASSSSSLSFTSGIDSTYKEYIFHFINIHPATDGVDFTFQASTDTGSSYGVTTTHSYFNAYHNEGDSGAALAYETVADLAQSTSYQRLNGAFNDDDGSVSGTLHLFDPSNTTFVKHFMTAFNVSNASDQILTTYSGGYANTTSAINAIDFKVNSGNIDSGTITMYGVL